MHGKVDNIGRAPVDVPNEHIVGSYRSHTSTSALELFEKFCLETAPTPFMSEGHIHGRIKRYGETSHVDSEPPWRLRTKNSLEAVNFTFRVNGRLSTFGVCHETDGPE